MRDRRLRFGIAYLPDLSWVLFVRADQSSSRRLSLGVAYQKLTSLSDYANGLVNERCVFQTRESRNIRRH